MSENTAEEKSTGAMNPEIAKEIENLLREKRENLSRIREIGKEVDELYVQSGLPTICVSDSGHDYAILKEGTYYIDAPSKKVELVSYIYASSSRVEVTLKSGEEVDIDNFFTEEEQESLYETYESTL